MTQPRERLGVAVSFVADALRERCVATTAKRSAQDAARLAADILGPQDFSRRESSAPAAPFAGANERYVGRNRCRAPNDGGDL